ncbi:MAG: peptidylprolyl isomerase [Oscillospiraceae bacterium]|nr:peptidylprolyl isomerase [Oscillospiraceae bacterium]
MSASSEKKRRQAERLQGPTKKAELQREAEEKARKSSMKLRLITGAIALFVVFCLVVNSSLPFHLTAVKVGDEAYSAAEMNYFYANAYYEYSEYMNMFGVDFNAPLQSQECLLMEDGTWHDFLSESAVESAHGMFSLHQEAMSEGFQLSAEGQKAVDEAMASLPEYAEANGFDSVDKYLLALYGTGMTQEILRDMITKGNLVNEYVNSVAAEFTYEASELEAYYDEHADEFNLYDLSYYFIAAETEEVTDADGNTSTQIVEGAEEVALADAVSIATEITDRASFDAAVAAYKEGAVVSDAAGSLKSNLNIAYADWVADAARQAGDVETFMSANGAYIVMFNGMDDNKYPTTAMRHILVKTVDADGDGVYSDDEKAKAKAAVEAIEAEWLAGEKTEESFAALAGLHSEDAGSNGNGGLYEEIGKGDMVGEIDAFLFAEDRQIGDTAIVHGNNGGYDGYHLVFFAGEGDSYHLALAENAKMNKDYAAWEEGVLAKYTVSEAFGLRFMGK